MQIITPVGQLRQDLSDSVLTKSLIGLNIDLGQLQGPKTVIRLDAPIAAGPFPQQVTLTLDKRLSKVGDMLILFLNTTGTPGFTSLQFQSQDFYVWGCGEPVTSMVLNTKNMIMFVYDGEQFVSTFDNC